MDNLQFPACAYKYYRYYSDVYTVPNYYGKFNHIPRRTMTEYRGNNGVVHGVDIHYSDLQRIGQRIECLFIEFKYV